MLVLARDGSMLRGFLSADGKWRLPITVDAVDPIYRRMLIAAEDRRFVQHWGIDPIAALRALGQLALNGRAVSGASTLTMQAVRLLERRPRTLLAKLIEMEPAEGARPAARRSSIRPMGPLSPGMGRRCRSKRPAGRGRCAGWSMAGRCRPPSRGARFIGSRSRPASSG
jgi:transglycosylase-like protein